MLPRAGTLEELAAWFTDMTGEVSSSSPGYLLTHWVLMSFSFFLLPLLAGRPRGHCLIQILPQGGRIPSVLPPGSSQLMALLTPPLIFLLSLASLMLDSLGLVYRWTSLSGLPAGSPLLQVQSRTTKPLWSAKVL